MCLVWGWVGSILVFKVGSDPSSVWLRGLDSIQFFVWLEGYKGIGHGASSSLPTGAPHSPTSCQRPRLRTPELGYAPHALTDSRRKTTSMWVELVRSNRTDQLNPHLRSIFLSRDQPNSYNPPTKHGSM